MYTQYNVMPRPQVLLKLHIRAWHVTLLASLAHPQPAITQVLQDTHHVISTAGELVIILTCTQPQETVFSIDDPLPVPHTQLRPYYPTPLVSPHTSKVIQQCPLLGRSLPCINVLPVVASPAAPWTIVTLVPVAIELVIVLPILRASGWGLSEGCVVT